MRGILPESPPPIVCEVKVDNSQKITEVRTCSDCCKECNPDGTPNIVGMLFRQHRTRTLKDGSTYVDCQWCPVTQGIPDEEWERILADMDGTP